MIRKNEVNKRTQLLIVALLLLIVFSLISLSAVADSFTEHRVQVGLKLFRTLMAADQNLENKIDSDRNLTIIIFHGGNQRDAQQFLQSLSSKWTSIDQYTLILKTRDLRELQGEDNKVAGIFISEPLKESELETLIKYSFRHHVILFSPFEGDVERGVLGGLSVQATVRPLINMKALKQGAFNIKPFYLKVAKQYE